MQNSAHNTSTPKDRWPTPFQKMVTFGESHTVGIAATQQTKGWPYVLKSLIDQFQDAPVALVNRGLGADILSKQSPIYASYQNKRPIGIERYRKHVIECHPDLVIISYGYNDLRSGTPLQAFQKDLQTVLTDLQKETNSLIVLLTTYFVPGKGFRNQTGGTITGEVWNRGTPELQHSYNQVLKNLAHNNDCLLADVYQIQQDADWTFCSPSGEGDIHANDLGHQLIANKVFETLATQCSCLSIKPLREREQTGKSPWRNGSESIEANLIRDFYPNSPYIDQYT